MKTLGRIISTLLMLVLLFFAAYSVFTVFAPALKLGAGFIDVIKEMAIGIYEGFRLLFGI